MRASIRVPATIHPLPGGEAIVAAPAAGRFVRGRRCSRLATACEAGQVLGRLEPRLAGGCRPGHARRRRRGGARGRRRRHASSRRGPSGCWRNARCPRGASRTRGAPRCRGGATAGGGSASGAARRDAAHRRRRRGRQRVRAARADRRPAGRGHGARWARPTTKARRSSASSGRIALELEVQVPAADVASGAATAARSSLEIPGITEPFELEPDHVHDSGVIDPTHAGAALQMEIPNPGERLLVGQAATAVLLRPRATPRCPRCRRPRC